MLDKLLNAKFRSRYSFNFLAVAGLIFLLFNTYIFINEELYTANITNVYAIGFPLLFLTIFTFFITGVIGIIYLFIYCIEETFRKTISNEKFLKSKIIFFLQILGVLSAVIPGIIMSVIFLYPCILYFSL